MIHLLLDTVIPDDGADRKAYLTTLHTILRAVETFEYDPSLIGGTTQEIVDKHIATLVLSEVLHSHNKYREKIAHYRFSVEVIRPASMTYDWLLSLLYRARNEITGGRGSYRQQEEDNNDTHTLNTVLCMRLMLKMIHVSDNHCILHHVIPMMCNV